MGKKITLLLLSIVLIFFIGYSLIKNTYSTTTYNLEINTNLEIDENNKIIKHISNNMTISEFLEKTSITDKNVTIKIYDSSNNEKNNTDIISTGDILIIYYKDEVKYEYTLSVTGDVNGDGNITLTDLSQIRRHIVSWKNPETGIVQKITGIYYHSIDMNHDGEVTLTDLSKMRKKISGVEFEKNEDIKFEIIVNKTLSTEEKIYFLNSVSGTETASDAILIESNGKYAMIDTGYDDDGEAENRILKFLQEECDIETLEFILITHGHKDHVGLYDEISDIIEVKNLYIKESGYNFSSGYKNVIDKANSSKTTIINVEEENSSFILGDITFNLYNTEFISEMSDTRGDNANSIATVATVHGKKIYFAGDIGSYSRFGTGLDTEIPSAKEIGVVDVFKVAHHGYTTFQNSSEALSYIKPTYAIFTNFSTNEQTYDVISRIKELNSNYQKSYYVSDGTITMEIAENGTITFAQ